MGIISDIANALQETAKLKTDTFKAVNDALELVNKSNLESEKIPGAAESINSIQARLSGFSVLADQVGRGEYDPHLVTFDYLKKFLQSVQAINTAQSEIIVNLTRLIQHGGFGNMDENWVISNKGNDQTFTLGSALINLDNSIDRALERYYLLSPAIGNPDIVQLSSFTRELQTILDEIKQAKANAKRDATYIGQKVSEIDDAGHSSAITVNDISVRLDEAHKYRDDAQKAFEAISATLNLANEKLPPMQEASLRADELKKKIDQHHDAFDKFDAEMDSRIEASDVGKQKLQLLIQNFEKQKVECDAYVSKKKEEIEALILRAEEMLGLATSAGLGATFQKQAKDRGAGIVASYIVIAGSLLCIAIMGVWAARAGWNEGNFLIKIAVIIPLGILVSIATKTLRRLEQSKEYYEHKASVSHAVEGYRKLFDHGDPMGPQDLIKDTVKEVLKNPAESLSTSEGRAKESEDSDVLERAEKFVNLCEKFTDTCKKALKA